MTSSLRRWNGKDILITMLSGTTIFLLALGMLCSSSLSYNDVNVLPYMSVELTTGRKVINTSDGTTIVSIASTSGFALVGSDGLTFLAPPEKDSDTGLFIYKSVHVPDGGFSYSSAKGVVGRMVVLSGEARLDFDHSYIVLMIIAVLLALLGGYVLYNLPSVKSKE